MDAISCISCGAPYGGPHRPGCAFETFRLAIVGMFRAPRRCSNH